MDNKEYYENFNWDDAHLNEKLKNKIQQIVSIIPEDVNTILDVGCGDGAISNELNVKFEVTATDRSFNSLKYVKANKIQSSADNLCFFDNKFDLVFSSEMIEHLPDEIFTKAMKEFQRLSKKYIMLSFPNNENIGKNLVQCVKCTTNFNKSYHLRSLNKYNVQKLLPSYKLINSFETGTPIRGYHHKLLNIKHKYAKASSWIPKHWTPDGRRVTMCPACNHSFDIPFKFSLTAFFCDSLNVFLSPKKPYQICLLFEKQ
jgi:ubiquinone/menaquinone biosynthesis C-methylase UbiE